MGREYVGCAPSGKVEVSKVKNPANKMSAHLIAKTADNPNKPETTDMAEAAEVQKAATAIANKLFAMNDVTKAHYLTLDETAQTSFLAKSNDDMAKEAETAKKAKEDAKAAEDLAKSGKTAKEAELEKSISDLKAENAEIKKALAESAETKEVEKTARSADYAGYPGGEAVLVPLIKSANKLPAAERDAMLATFKSTAETAKRFGGINGFRSEDDIAKSAPASARIDKAAKDYAAEKKMTFFDAYAEISEMPEYAADFAAAAVEAN